MQKVTEEINQGVRRGQTAFYVNIEHGDFYAVADILESGTPMTYAYYHNVIKGKSPKNAPTYIPEEEKKMSGEKAIWKCTVCGYEYDENKEDLAFAELPEDWKCPVCLQPKTKFEKVED